MLVKLLATVAQFSAVGAVFSVRSRGTTVHQGMNGRTEACFKLRHAKHPKKEIPSIFTHHSHHIIIIIIIIIIVIDMC
jgi:hypothetical protein